MQATALVTGGTGGLGVPVVEQLLASGMRVVVPWIAERELERLPAEPQADGSLVTVRATGPTGPESVGDELTLSIDPAQVHLFDRASGTRIGP